MPESSRRRTPLLVLAVMAILALGIGAWWQQRRPAVPDPSSQTYRDMVSAFYTGLIALQTGEDKRAAGKLAEATKIVPEEPAAWADLGLLQLRASDFDGAAQNLEKARSLAPQNAQIEALLGLLQNRQGKFDEAVTHLRRAVELDPKNLQAIFALVQAINQQKGPGGDAKPDAEVPGLLGKILQLQPDNLAALLQLVQAQAERGDAAGVRQTTGRIAKIIAALPADAADPREQLRLLQASTNGSDVRGAGPQAVRLGNVLNPISAKYRQDREAIESKPDQVGQPIERFLVLPPPSPLPAPPDTALTFVSEPLPSAANGPFVAARALFLASRGRPQGRLDLQPVPVPEDKPVVFVMSKNEVSRADGSAPPLPGSTTSGADNILGMDWNYDFKTDLVLTGAGGLRLLQQNEKGGFSDITAKTALPPAVTKAALGGAWPADIESDGDLDIVLGAPGGTPTVLRNNRDGTFVPIRPFGGVAGLRAFAWADLDGDGDVDAALADGARKLHVFANERSGQFRERSVPGSVGPIAGLAIGEMSGDSVLDVLALQSDGALMRVSDKAADDGSSAEASSAEAWDVAEIARAAGGSTAEARLFVADFDNNGGLDVLVAGEKRAQVWLSDQGGKFNALAAPLEATIFSVADLNSDGRLDLVGLAAGKPVRLLNRGAKTYHYQVFYPRASPKGAEVAGTETLNDQRINSFGIGGEVEVRSGLLLQKQAIIEPRVHFGLGEADKAEVGRVVWPNGSVKAEFDVQPDKTLIFEQRLQTSCPFLFAWDGKAMRFVTDCIWRSPLGLKINAQDTAGVMQTEDWIKIRGDQLKPRHGFYDLSVTAELWETHFFDHLSLMTVDHPIGIDIFVDERLAFPQPPLQVYAVKPPRPFKQVRDEKGRDVSSIVRARDGNYLGTFKRGDYQGLAKDHWVEIDLDASIPQGKPLYLVANGWIRPTNSSINVAIGQGRHDKPQGLSLEVPDAKGNWTLARPGLGFPEGKVKTVLISLDGVFKPNAPRRLRLRTNLEIFWDSINWAEGLPGAPLRKQRVEAGEAGLNYRGFSVVTAKDATSPEMPASHEDLAGTAPRWRPLSGFYTRFGDVRPLLKKVDDRYVIMNAGDEMKLRFAAPPAPPAGWVRDFVLIGDGWVKDGDFNTTFSKTVQPLPLHNRPDYSTPPGRLQDDPAYRLHQADWQTFHTRYVTPQRFQNALRLSD